MTQKLLDEYTDEPDLFEFDHYGPTMDRPLPKCEETRLAWKEQLRNCGFSPDCLQEAAYTGREWAHSDLENPDQRELEFEELATALARDREEQTDPTEFSQEVPTVEEISNEITETMNDTNSDSTENSQQNNTEAEINHPNGEQIKDRLEGLLSLGAPTCDECQRLSPDDRPDEGEFWPDEIHVFVHVGEQVLAEWRETRCPYHADLIDQSAYDAHVLASSELAEDKQEYHKGSHRYTVHRIDPIPDGTNEETNESEGIDENESEESDSNPRYYGIGGGRRKTLDAIDDKDRLDAIETPDTLSELKEAITDISLMQPDGSYYMSPPENPIRTINRVYEDLPDDAKPHYVTDETLVRRVNAARRQFNKWLGRLQREKRMPSPVEAGPENYPAQKARDKARYQHEAYDELKEKIDRIRSGANGARQRALNQIGSSVAEQNEQEAKSLMEQRREEWEPGDIVVYRSPNLHAAAIVRLNEKSVRVQRSDEYTWGDGHYGPGNQFVRETIDLDSDFLTKYDPDDLGDIENLDRGQEIPDSLEAAQRQLLGDEWVDEHTDSDEPDETEQQEAEAVSTDGGHIEETDPDDPPSNETVRLITGITRVMHVPLPVAAETSSTGNTIRVTHPIHDKTHRLDAETIFSGECEYRNGTYYEIYTKERFQKRQRANKAPGPRSGTDEVTPKHELPEPTHRPLGEAERERERRERLENEGKEIVTDGGFTPEELADDDDLLITISEISTVIASVDSDRLTSREQSRLSTIRTKTRELEEIVRDRLIDEYSENEGCEIVTDGGQILVACPDPDITRLEYAPHRVSVELVDGEFKPDGHNDLLDAEWRETDTYWCHGCDTELPSTEAAQEHVSKNQSNDGDCLVADGGEQSRSRRPDRRLMTVDHTRPTSDWEFSHAINEGDVLVDTQYDDGPFTVVKVHDDGSVTLLDQEHRDEETFDEAEITGALADGNLERESDGLSHELATF